MLAVDPSKPRLSGQTVLDLVPPALRIAARLVERQGGETPDGDWENVDIASAADSDGRSVGIEHAALAALDMLGLPELLDGLGFNRRQRCCALATIAARMAAPGSERATNRWLRRTSAPGELLGIDFGALSDMALYRASDRLLGHQKKIKDHLFARAQSLFDFAPTIALYDLTNTYYAGQTSPRRSGAIRRKAARTAPAHPWPGSRPQRLCQALLCLCRQCHGMRDS